MDQNVANMSPLPVPGLTDLAPGCPLILEEILRLIFQFADRASLVAAARVSKRWSGIALDELWRDMSSIFPLFKLLAPQNWILDATKFYKTLLSSLAQADWNVFRKYALRIRYVNIDHSVDKADIPLNSAALVQTFHGLSPLLPNVRTITWRFINKENCTSIIPFLGPQLESLELRMDECISPGEQSLLMQSLVHRTPNLSFLSVASFASVNHMSIPLASFISSLPKLVHLKLPAYFLTKEVVTAITKLPLLTKLEYSDWEHTEKTYQSSGMCFKFTPGSLPWLNTLAFASMPTRMAEVLQATDHVERLLEIKLDCPAYYSEQEIRTVFAKLAAGARRLCDIQLLCCPLSWVENSSNDSFSINTIRPLFSCTQLRRLHISAPHFAPLQNEDVVEMGASWPGMRSLSLCPSPLTKRNLGVPFEILSTFAKSFPNLQKLRLFFGKEVSEFDGDLYPAYQLTKLEIVGVGLSPVPRGKAQDIGFLLASLCQNPPLIESGPTVYHRGDRTTEKERANVIAACSEVGYAMKLAFRIKSSVTRKFDTAGSAAELASGTL